MNRALLSCSLVLALAGCGGATGAPTSTVATATPADDAVGGRLYDRWSALVVGSDFTPDVAATADVVDGSGGPNGDGTLAFGDGRVLLNSGHDYRFPRLFGWDLRGRAGLSGPSGFDRAWALDVDLLELPGGVSEIADLLERGDARVPAFGAVIPRADLEAIATFVVKMRDGELPRASDFFELTSGPGHYALLPGGDAERGRALYADRCAGCHGADGAGFLLDDGEYSVGSHARQSAYEDWFKILNGQPGTPMGRQVRGATGPEMAQEIRDLLAALCDRTTFPRGAATEDDVADGDPRCGAYLR